MSRAVSPSTRCLAPPAMRHLLRTLLVLPLCAASIAFAADKPAKKEGALGTGKPTGGYLTRDELRTCLARRDKLKALDAELLDEQAAITAQKAQITRDGDELKGKFESIDRTSPEAVSGYNEAVQARDKQIEAFQARVNTFNTRVEADRAERAGFGPGCTNRRYFEEDEEAIKRGK
jgi:hypothetical protein